MPPAIPDKIPCETEYQLEREIEALRVALDQEETEESWEVQQRALARFKSLVRGGAYKHDSFVPSLKPLCRFISSPLLSERGRLSAVAIELVSTLASALGKRFDPLMQGFAPTLMKLCQRPNKVVITRTTACITAVIKQTRLVSIIPHLREAVKDKSVNLRTVAAEATYLCFAHIDEDKLGNKVADLELIIKTTGRDPNPEVRKQARAIMGLYRERFPDRYAAFTAPLTPVTRKYLEVGKAPVDPPQPLNLFKQPLQAAAPVTFPERPSSSASTHRPMKAKPLPQAFTAEALPPRPHSSAAMHSRAPPFVRSPPTLVSNKPAPIPRPLSVNLLSGTQNQGIERPRSMFVEPTQPQRPIVVSLSGPQTTMEGHKLPEAVFDANMDPRQRQRSISVSRGRDEAEPALRLLDGGKPHKVHAEGSGDPPLRSAPGTSSAVARSKAAMSMRRYDGVLNRNQRPISVTSDTLEQFRPQDENTAVESSQPPTTTSSRPTSVHVETDVSRPFSLPARTPKSAVERPQVVYLPSSEVETTATAAVGARAKPQKTWSMSHQLELLNRRKKAGEAKAEEQNAPTKEQEADVAADDKDTEVRSGLEEDAVIIAQVETAVEEVATRGKVDQPQTEVLAQPTETNAQSVASVSEPQELQVDKAEEKVTLTFPTAESRANTSHKENVKETAVVNKPTVIAFPSSEPEQAKPTASRAQSPSDAPVSAPNMKVAQQSAPTTTAARKPAAVDKAPAKEVFKASSSSKATTQAPTRIRTISATSKQSAPPPRARVISTSSSKDKDSMKMPVRVPSRNASQSTAFVPKRGAKSSVTQPTKSQAARAQAMLDEKATAATTASEKTSQASMARKQNELNTRGQQLKSKASTAETNDKQGQVLSSTANTVETKQRTHGGPRKAAVPTVSSLVKTHAAKREAGLSQVAHLLGLPSTNANGKSGTSKAKTKTTRAPAAPMKKMALTIQERQPFKPRSNTGSLSGSPKQSIKDILLAYGENDKAQGTTAGDPTGQAGLVSQDSAAGGRHQPLETKSEMGIVA